MTQLNDNTSRFLREVRQLIDDGDIENVIVSYWFHDITVITKTGTRLILPAKEGKQQIRKALNQISEY
jgi:hypothetical protein